ncbi:hypothetical protein U1Q18_017315 [Sarracenia purpurea var. burkii]
MASDGVCNICVKAIRNNKALIFFSSLKDKQEYMSSGRDWLRFWFVALYEWNVRESFSPRERGGAELDDPVTGGLDGSADVGGDDEVEGVEDRADVGGDDEVEGIETGGSKGGRQGGKRIELRLEVDEAGDENVGWNTERERREADEDDLRG